MFHGVPGVPRVKMERFASVNHPVSGILNDRCNPLLTGKKSPIVKMGLNYLSLNLIAAIQYNSTYGCRLPVRTLYHAAF